MTQYYIKYECPKCGLTEYYDVLPLGLNTVEFRDRYCLRDGYCCERSVGNYEDNKEEMIKAGVEGKIYSL